VNRTPYPVFIAFALMAMLGASRASLAADGRCLEYVPAVVTLAGTITRHMGYGPPGFGEDPANDAKEHYWRLDLDKPICINGSGKDDPNMQGERNVKHLEIVYENEYPTGGDWVGHRVSITGTLYHGFSGHHHTRVLITAAETEMIR
jgi:hypothetical protein